MFCISETCVCDDGWGHQNCLVNLSIAVEISDITGGGKCDVSTDGNCDHVIVVSDNGLIPAVSAEVLVKTVGKLNTFQKEINTHVAEATLLKLFTIRIKHGFSCINIRQVPRKVLKTAAGHLRRNLANVNALKNHVPSR